MRLSRNKKTGKAKHYAFLEFQYPEVAQIAADAMDGYFMFKQKIVAKVLPWGEASGCPMGKHRGSGYSGEVLSEAECSWPHVKGGSM